MNRILLTIVVAVMTTFGSQNVFGQVGKITLLHNGVSTFHTTLSAAQTAAINGDTIYLPGGTIAATTLSKQLTIIGAGHYPDSTAATYPTIISGNLTFLSGASGGKLVGVSVNVYFSSNITWTSYELNRCHLAIDCSSYYPGANAQNILISECVIGTLTSSLTFGSVAFEKNIFGTSGQIYRNPAMFLNNIFYCSTVLSPSYNSLFINNIFIAAGTTSLSLQNINTCTFTNNLFCTTGTSLTITNWGTSSNFTNNITGELAVNTFVNATTTSFSYANNYHLLTSSPGNNFGTDMTDVGIYGTAFPCKDGGLPFNPHISSKTIGTMISPTGNLSVDIKVTAQDR